MKKSFKIIAIIMLLMSLILFVSCEFEIPNDDEKENTDINDNGENGDDIGDNTDDENKDEITIDSVCTIEDALKLNWYCITEYVITDVKVGFVNDKDHENIVDYLENFDFITYEEYVELLKSNDYNKEHKYYVYEDPEHIYISGVVTYSDKYNFKIGQKVLDCHRNKWNAFSRFIFEDSLLNRDYHLCDCDNIELIDNAKTIEEVSEVIGYRSNYQGFTIYYGDTNVYDNRFWINSEGGANEIILEFPYIYIKDDNSKKYKVFLYLEKVVDE